MNTRSASARHGQFSKKQNLPTGSRLLLLVTMTGSLTVAGLFSYTFVSVAATPPINLGTTESYSVLGGETVTNTGPSILNGDLGVSPGTATPGFPPGLVNGTIHAGNVQAAQAKSDLVIAYDETASRQSTAQVGPDLVGQTLTDGVYTSSGPLALGGTLTLDGQNDPASVFIFQAASTLITASSSTVSLVNGAQACNVFWQVGSSATLGTGSTFVGSILALTSITVDTNARVEGRALARNGEVTLDSNLFTDPSCSPVPSDGPSTSAAPTDTATTGTPTDTATTTPSVTPGGAVTSTPGDTTTTPPDTPAGAAGGSPTDNPDGALDGGGINGPGAGPGDDLPGGAAGGDGSDNLEADGYGPWGYGAENQYATELADTGAGDTSKQLLALGMLLLFAGGGFLALRRARGKASH